MLVLVVVVTPVMSVRVGFCSVVCGIVYSVQSWWLVVVVVVRVEVSWIVMKWMKHSGCAVPECRVESAPFSLRVVVVW